MDADFLVPFVFRVLRHYRGPDLPEGKDAPIGAPPRAQALERRALDPYDEGPHREALKPQDKARSSFEAGRAVGARWRSRRRACRRDLG